MDESEEPHRKIAAREFLDCSRSSVRKTCWNVACVLSCFGQVRLFATLWTCILPSSSAYGILQVRILDWVAMPSSRQSSRPRDQTHVSCLLYWQAESLPPVPPGERASLWASRSLCDQLGLCEQYGWSRELCSPDYEGKSSAAEGGENSLAHRTR